MKRSAPMKRSELKRTPFKKKASKSKATFHPSVRAMIEQRSGGRCEAGVDGCRHHAAHIHHIRRRSQGGSGDVENGLHVCHVCHLWIHEHPADAAKKGWLAMGRAG